MREEKSGYHLHCIIISIILLLLSLLLFCCCCCYYYYYYNFNTFVRLNKKIICSLSDKLSKAIRQDQEHVFSGSRLSPAQDQRP